MEKKSVLIGKEKDTLVVSFFNSNATKDIQQNGCTLVNFQTFFFNAFFGL